MTASAKPSILVPETPDKEGDADVLSAGKTLERGTDSRSSHGDEASSPVLIHARLSRSTHHPKNAASVLHCQDESPTAQAQPVGAKRRRQLLASSEEEEDGGWVTAGGGASNGADGAGGAAKGAKSSAFKTVSLRKGRDKLAAGPRAGAVGKRIRQVQSDDSEASEEQDVILVPDDTPAKKAVHGGVGARKKKLESDDDDEAVPGEKRGSTANNAIKKSPRSGAGHRAAAAMRKPLVIDSEEEDEDEEEGQADSMSEASEGEYEEEDEDLEKTTGGLLEEVEKIGAKLTRALDAIKDERKKVEQPQCLGGDTLKLKGYQLVGLNWLRVLHQTDVNGIIADEMGLGKTIQLISFLAHLNEADGIRGPHLVVCPASVVSNWERELTTWLPCLRVVIYHGSQKEREELRCQDTSEWDIVLTTYTLFERDSGKPDRSFLKSLDFEVMALDEAHSIKNAGTSKYRKLLAMSCVRRVLLTGTPINNSLPELLVLLQFLMPDLFDPDDERLVAVFDEASVEKRKGKLSENAAEKTMHEEGAGGRMEAFFERLKQIVKPFILRRRKQDVLHELVKKEVKVLTLDLTEGQQTVYKDIIHRHVQQKEAHGLNKKIIQNIFFDLRKAANHPLLVRTSRFTDTDVEDISVKLLHAGHYGSQCSLAQVRKEVSEYSDFKLHEVCSEYKGLHKYALNQDDICASAKLRYLQTLLPQLKNDGHRVLIFSQWTTMLDILEEFLTNLGMLYSRLDGSTAVKERQQLIDDFKADEDITCFLLSTRAGGMGINLTSADTVILHDLDFNPMVDRQAEDRCHRIGQTRPVTVYKMVSKGTVDEKIYSISERKGLLAATMMGEQDREGAGDADEGNIQNLIQEILQRHLLEVGRT